jgi:hypothetical protein
MTQFSRAAAAVLLVAVVATIPASDAVAQRVGAARPAIEISGTYGSMWGGNIPLNTGKLRSATGDAWGVALSYPLQPGMWVELGYNHQGGALDWDPNRNNKVTLTDMSVNHWHVSGVRGFGRPGGAAVPFVIGGLGLTHFSPDARTVSINGEDYAVDSVTKFAVNFGAGFKAYFGEAKRVGIRATFRVFSTLYDASGGFYFGSGGAGLGVGGSALWQYEAAGGLTIKFGG